MKALNSFVWTVVAIGLVHTTLCITTESEFAPIVQLSGGQVRGLIQSVDNHTKVYLYQGIRYGRAKRFERPVAVSNESWSGVYNATEWRSACPQAGIVVGQRTMQTDHISEDCLFLNVWTPTTEESSGVKSLPVMVFIHGGGFTIGTIFTHLLNGAHLVGRGQVVLVAMNYRLGAFGFLYGGTEQSPGNLGYHDQVLALQWVRHNIGHFHGDPSQVTVFGESAGAYSVGTLMLSPLATGLFHRAIMQSGAPNSVTGAISRTAALANAHALARNLSCPVTPSQAMVECLQAKPMHHLVQYTQLDYNNTDRYFTPVFGDQVLPLAPVDALRRGVVNRHIDLMYGVTAEEGSLFALNMFPSFASNTTPITQHSAHDHIVHVSQVYKQTYGEQVARFYLDSLPHNHTTDDLKQAVSRAFGDCHIVCPTITFGEQVALVNRGSHYYSYRLTQHLPVPGFAHYPWMGVIHSEDVFYLFAHALLTAPVNRQLGLQMIDAWTNFAKSGRPSVPEWSDWKEAFTNQTGESKHTQHYQLEVTHPQMVEHFYKTQCKFWSDRIHQ